MGQDPLPDEPGEAAQQNAGGNQGSRGAFGLDQEGGRGGGGGRLEPSSSKRCRN